MKQWLAVMIILAMEWPDVGSVETKGPEDLMEHYYGNSWAKPVDNTKWAELEAERVVDGSLPLSTIGRGGYWFGKKKKNCAQVKNKERKKKCIRKKQSRKGKKGKPGVWGWGNKG